MFSATSINVSFCLLVIASLFSGLRAHNGTGIEDAEGIINENTTSPEVRTSQGIIRGIHMVTHHGRKIFGFRGIPYAKPPIGNLRFKGPVPAEPWIGTLDASRESDPCPHRKHALLIGNEDCLYLRVYTPQLPDNESGNTTLLPVMVYIYGGGFNVGSADSTRYGPYFLLDKDIILVVPTYRLSALGFLSTGDEVSPGNYGLKDMVQALKWTKDNIRYFGGDPNQVTLVGGSSGSMSVELLSLSHLTTGLFHRIVMQSGSAMSANMEQSKNTPRFHAIRLGKYFGCPTNTSAVLVECLRGIDALKLVDTNDLFYIWHELPAHVWGPVIEPETEGALLTNTPANILTNGKGHDLPRLLLMTSDEAVVQRSYLYKTRETVWENIIDVDVVLRSLLKYQRENLTTCIAALKSYYLHDLTMDQTTLLKNITQLTADAYFHYPLYRSMQLHLRYKKSPQYFCFFKYRGMLSHSYGLNRTTMGGSAVHGDEIIYLFQSPRGLYGPPDSEMNETDWKMVDLMVQLWSSFVTNGMLTSSDLNDTINWEPYSSRMNHLSIGTNAELSLGVGHDFFENRAKFWEYLTANNMWD